MVIFACSSADRTPMETGGATGETAERLTRSTEAEATSQTTTSQPPSASTTIETTTPGPTSARAGLVWGHDARSPAVGWRRPALGAVGTDPAYGTTIRRVTSASGTRFNRNTYSRRQAENADGTLFMTYHGTAAYHIYATADQSLVATLTVHPDGEPQWHPTEPAQIRHLAGANSYDGRLQLLETDVRTDATSVIADLTQRLQAAIPGAAYMKDRAEGAPSIDGNRYAWLVYDDHEQVVGLASYDLSTDTVLGTTTTIPGTLDWVSMSPLGRYVVAGGLIGTYIYDAALGNRRLLTEAAEHSDLAVDVDGGERYVYVDFNSSSRTGGWLTSIDLRTLERTRIFNLYDKANTSVHVSGKGYDKPGWVVVSTYDCKEPGAWTCDKVMAVELAPGGRVLNLAHTYNCGDNYWTETHAVVNRSFTRIYFNSDAGSCGIDAEVYRLDIDPFD